MTTTTKRANRVNADALAVLIDLTTIPKGKQHWLSLNHATSQAADILVDSGLAECNGPADEDGHRSFWATPKGRQVASAMFGAAHKAMFGEDREYTA